MAEIKIQRKRRLMWWPVLLLLLVPLAWYLYTTRLAAKAPAGPHVRTSAAPRIDAAASRSLRPGAWRIDV